MTVFTKFSLTRECWQQILFAFAYFLPSPNAMPCTVYTFIKLLANFQGRTGGVNEHYYCHNCMQYLSAREVSTCPSCKHDTNQKGSFLHISLANTLRSFLENEKMYIYLAYSQDREKLELNALEDMVDGESYKVARENPENTMNFSLFWNTDGVKVFKSSGSSLWPLHCMIPELPPLLRKRFQVLAQI